VERKSLPNLVTSVTTGKLRCALGELAALPRAAVVIEDRYSAIFKITDARPPPLPTLLPSPTSSWASGTGSSPRPAPCHPSRPS
jgi:hypothetical protein